MTGTDRRGFTTVYLLVILASLSAMVILMINAASARAARSIAETVCATAGRSVLSEYQKDLYERYGVFALRGDDALLSRLSRFYIDSSLAGGKALAKPSSVLIEAGSEAYPALDTAAFGSQIRKLAPGAAVIKGNVLEYILSHSDGGVSGLLDGLPDGSGTGTEENASGTAEQDVSGSAEKEFDKDADRNRGRALSEREARELPSALLGYHKRVSLLFSGGIKDLAFSTLLEDEYILALCSDAVRTKDGYLELETEYILYGNRSDKANLKAVKLSLFSLRFAVNEVKYVSETGELLVSTTAAVLKTVEEVRTILAGGKVDGLDYAMYLRVFLALIPRNEKLARLMDVMQINVTKIDGANFSFKGYAYGFDLNASFVHRGRTGDVEQTYIYQ